MNKGIILNNNEISDLLTGNIPLNEVYIGKTKELLAAEQQLDKFRNKYLGSYVFNTKVNADPDLLKFNRMIEEIFGFGCCTVQITNTDQINAGTISIDSSIDYIFHKDNIIINGNGYKFKPEFDYSCFIIIWAGLIFNSNFTTSEIMAFILHEVGHNFQSVIDKKDGVMLKLFNMTSFLINIITSPKSGIILGVIQNTKTKKFIAKTGKRLRNDDSFPIAVYDICKQVLDAVNAYKNNIKDLKRILSLGFINGIPINLYKFIKSPIKGILKLKSGYTGEQIADNFASMYGYGSELSSGLTKMQSTSGSTIMQTVDKIPIISTLIHINELPFIMIAKLFDEHPEAINRIKDQIQMLKYELDKEDIDPKMAYVIRSDIKECEEALDALIDCTNVINDPYFGKKLYNNIINIMPNIRGKIFGSSNRYEEYDKLFNKGGN